MRTECPDCEKPIRGRRCVCGWAPEQHKPQAPSIPRWQTPEWLKRPPPISQDKHQAAARVVARVLAKDLTVEQAHAALAELFGLPWA